MYTLASLSKKGKLAETKFVSIFWKKKMNDNMIQLYDSVKSSSSISKIYSQHMQ